MITISNYKAENKTAKEIVYDKLIKALSDQADKESADYFQDIEEESS